MDSMEWVDVITRENLLLLSLLPKLNIDKFQFLTQRFDLSSKQMSSLNSEALTTLGFDQQQTGLIQSAICSPHYQRAINWHQPERYQYVITYADSQYPAMLKEIARPPYALLVKGNCKLLNTPQIAIVGSRNPSASGNQIARQFASQLTLVGITITSGLAMGVDASAHLGALDAKGSTVAVLGCGIDVIYPKRNRDIYAQIVDQGGLLVSEFFPGTQAKASHFPRRNRIVSGLSFGTLVVEAARRSGSLITARTALEQNRDVFAVPGNVLNTNAAGCNYLIQQGAKLVTSVEDILDEYQHLIVQPPNDIRKTVKKSAISPLASDTLLDSVEFDVTALDVIAERNKLPVHAVMAALLEYELRGLVAAVPGGYIKLRGK